MCEGRGSGGWVGLRLSIMYLVVTSVYGAFSRFAPLIFALRPGAGLARRAGINDVSSPNYQHSMRRAR